MLRRLGTLSVALMCASLALAAGAAPSQANEPVPCEVKDSPDVERPSPGTFVVHLRTEIVCFGTAVVTPGD